MITVQKRTDCWERIGGATCVVTDQTGLTLNHMYHMSTPMDDLRSLKWPTAKQAIEFSTRWSQQLAALSSKYNSANDLAGHVAIRTWGITSSVIGGYVAVCVSFHPSDMIQYAMNSDQETVLFISKESNLPLSSCRSRFNHWIISTWVY